LTDAQKPTATPGPNASPAAEQPATVSLPVVGIAVRSSPYATSSASFGAARTAIRPWGTTVDTVAGLARAGYADTSAREALFDQPVGIAAAPDGTLFVTEAGGLRLRRIPPGGPVSTLAGDGTAGHKDGPGLQARFQHPLGLARRGSGELLVADASASVLRSVAPDGTVSTFAGVAAFGFRNGPANSAVFSYPTGVALGTDGVYVADFSNSRVRHIDTALVVTTFSGSGLPGFVDADRSRASFNSPVDIATGPQGELYVSDLLNHAIRTVDAAGRVRTLAGTGVPGFADGPGDQALFQFPAGLVVSADGHVFVADWGNHCIRRIDPAGQVTTVAGAALAGAADGPGAEARFSGPRSLCFGPQGELFVADQLNHSIRRIRILSRN
jgi:sugar lactone lactonase YvrE